MVRFFRWNGRKPHGTGTSRERHDHARRPSSNTAIASFARGAEPGTGDQSQDGGKVAQAGDSRGSEDRAEGPSFNDPAQDEEAAIVAFRRHTLLPLDDCLYALQPSIPHLSRSALHRCLQRHGISCLPDIEGDKRKRQRQRYQIGFFHMDIAKVQTAEGKLYLFIALIAPASSR